jgi:hypothetical protein
MDPGDMERLARAVDRLQQSSDRLHGLGNNATITVSAGGAGLWIAVTCCAVMLALSIGLGIGVVVLFQKYDRMQDHLSAIYMMAPQLKPEDAQK